MNLDDVIAEYKRRLDDREAGYVEPQRDVRKTGERREAILYPTPFQQRVQNKKPALDEVIYSRFIAIQVGEIKQFQSGTFAQFTAGFGRDVETGLLLPFNPGFNISLLELGTGLSVNNLVTENNATFTTIEDGDIVASMFWQQTSGPAYTVIGGANNITLQVNGAPHTTYFLRFVANVNKVLTGDLLQSIDITTFFVTT